jgi:parallel beta helix pectate lyase-like protein
MGRGVRTTGGRALRAGVVAAIAAFAAPAAAQAHIERPSYWPDPAPDTSVVPPAGGKAPTARTLASALRKKPPGRTLVVCKKNSLTLARRSIRTAVLEGYSIRPSDHRTLKPKRARKLRRINKKLAKRCRFDEIQPAATAARNNDRIVIMPGLYTEPTARKQPTNDPACKRYTTNTEFGDPGALSYAYHVHCPNDQNLIAVMGRAVGSGKDPDPPRYNRHGIPNTGRCIRCNVQMEGSGVSADDVVIDAGRVASGNHGPIGSKKDVGVRADRADGFVLRNVTVRHAGEHGIYVLESDGYLLDRFKTFYHGLYGTLTFVEDHGIQQNCEAVGNADSGIYPGASVETGVQRPLGTRFRYNQQIRRCDLHHNLAGYSATDGNAIHVHHNNFYDNALGLQTDVVTAAGHPGFPGDSQLIENNNFYSNNFDTYDEKSDVEPAFPFPVGTGMWIAGGNHHQVRNNRFWDNWRRGTMVFAVPDALVCGPDSGNDQAGCDASKTSTSHYNQHYDNTMGLSPAGRAIPNGTDFWWDDFGGNRGNCWFRNSGPKPLTYSPRELPHCDNGADPAMSVGIGSPTNEGELTSCLVAFETRNFDRSTTTCPWLFPPTKPGSAGKASVNAGQRVRLARAYAGFCAENRSSLTCAPAGTARLHLVPSLGCAIEAGDCSDRARPSTPKLPRNFNLQLYRCADWRRSDGATRRYVVWRLRQITSGQVTGTGVQGRGTVLHDDQAQRLFANYCGQRFARGFVLYKLYGAAAGFVGAAP